MPCVRSCARPRFGYRLLYMMPKRQGVMVNHKRVQRLYREEELAVRQRNRRRNCAAVTRMVQEAKRPDVVWAMDFVAYALSKGRRRRCLTLVDNYTRECMAIEVDTFLPSLRVMGALD
ncbi:IS3 family transposase [Polymorphum gilvum]|uniref:IS3 family transposase n=1 Tax=Polymorphum gilvum TaxID=991904 RepID=UPI002412C1EF|nr:IS3 family transposase [Polymorphum gilvum]